MANTQAQVKELLQSLLKKGLDASEAFPVVKALVESKIFSLDDIDLDTALPNSIPAKIQRKIRPKKTPRQSTNSPNKKQKHFKIEMPRVGSEPELILINRAPVLTLWGAIVAELLHGVDFSVALTFGSALASQVSKGKGEALGVYQKEHPVTTAGSSIHKQYDLMGHKITAKLSADGTAEVLDVTGKEIDPHRSWKLLLKRFGDENIGFVIRSMRDAAKHAGSTLASTAYSFYMHIRPDIPSGTKGWGAHGHLIMTKVQSFYNPDCKLAAVSSP